MIPYTSTTEHRPVTEGEGAIDKNVAGVVVEKDTSSVVATVPRAVVTSVDAGIACDECGSGVVGVVIGSDEEDGIRSTTVTATDGGPVPTCV